MTVVSPARNDSCSSRLRLGMTTVSPALQAPNPPPLSPLGRGAPRGGRPRGRRLCGLFLFSPASPPLAAASLSASTAPPPPPLKADAPPHFGRGAPRGEHLSGLFHTFYPSISLAAASPCASTSRIGGKAGIGGERDKLILLTCSRGNYIMSG